MKTKYVRIGMTQAAVEKTLGVNQPAVSFWETGKTAPQAAMLVKLAELYGCSVNELLRGKAEREGGV